MRTFNNNFITEKNKRGTAPINLLKFNFSTPRYVADRDITPPGGNTYVGLVKNWSFIDSALQQTPGSGILGNISLPDLSLVIINTESPRFSDNFTADDPPENVIVELYQFFIGLQSSEMELIFKGIIDEIPEYDEYECSLIIRGIWQKYNIVIGENKLISSDKYPCADPDDIGQMQNITYGDLKKIPCRAIKSGGVDNLESKIFPIAISIELSSALDFLSAGTIQCDEEKITYTGKTGNTLTGCTRGASATTALSHAAGASVWQVIDSFVYQIAGHPVKSIGDILVDNVRITSTTTKYTGQTGDELAGYEGQAVFSIPARITRQQAIDILVDDGMTIDDAIAVIDTIDVDDGITVGDNIVITMPGIIKTIYPDSPAEQDAAYDGNENTAYVMEGLQGAYWYCPSTSFGSIIMQEFWILIDVIGATVTISDSDLNTLGTIAGGNGKGRYRFRTEHSSWSLGVHISVPSDSVAYVYEIEKDVEYDGTTSKTGAASRGGTAAKIGAATKDGTVTREGTITLTGNSIADVTIGKLVTADVEGYKDDADGTYTGTPDALIERPDHVLKHIWGVLLDASAGDIDATTFDAAGTFFAAKNYKFAFVISSPIQAETLLTRLAMQCRCHFFVSPPGKAKLIVRQLNQPSGHAIIKNEIKLRSVSMTRSPIKELFNEFTLFYNRDWSKTGGKGDIYLFNKFFSDAISKTRYGTRNYLGSENMFCFDAITDDSMAQDVGDFFLSYHSLIRRMPQFAVFLDNMEIEPGDIIDITHPLDAMTAFICEVLKIIHVLGSAKNKTIDHIKVIAIEN